MFDYINQATTMTRGNDIPGDLSISSTSGYSLISILFLVVRSSCYSDMINQYSLVATFALTNTLITHIVMIYLFLWIKICHKFLISVTASGVGVDQVGKWLWERAVMLVAAAVPRWGW